MSNLSRRTVLLTGATGYVGGRMVELLTKSGYNVRCMARQPANLQHVRSPSVEVVQGDVLDPESTAKVLEGVHTAYYLIHSMSSKGCFVEEDRQAARIFGAMAKKAGVQRIIYLGGLGDPQDELSAHLQSRQEVGAILRESGVQVVEFRSSIVIGSGSLSFELVRSLVRKLPVMICPKWVHVVTQPIAVEDMLAYLVAGAEWQGTESRVFEIGAPETVTYGQIMQEFARQRGLWRLLISVPVLTPKLSSLWLGLVTPVYATIGRKLIDSLKNPTLVKDHSALTEFDIRPMGVSTAIERALANEDHEIAQTRWSDALSSSRGVRSWGGVHFLSRIVDSREAKASVPPEQAFLPIRRIGGKIGWYYADPLWTLRGWIDLLVGGVGKRRARRDPNHLRVGDVLDWWRVEEYRPNELLRLSAEMKVPGRAWLEFEVQRTPAGSSIRQTAIFDPVGLFGLAYWYALFPIHVFIFRGMLNQIVRRAEGPARTKLDVQVSGNSGTEFSR